MRENIAQKKHVGIWIRVSTEDQAQGDSPEHHELRAREYAKFNEWNVIELYNLAGVSGKTVVEHSEAKRMLADIRRGHISGLIFSKLARLARNTKELLEFADIFREHNADMISLHEKVDTSSPAGRLFYTIMAAMAQWEREESRERTINSIETRKKIGSPLGGPASFGYQWKDKKLIPHPKEAEVRRLMYELYVKHRRKKAVVRILNEKGYRTRKGVKFTSKTVTRLLQDPAGKGKRRANHTTRNSQTKQCELKPEEVWLYHDVEPIVSAELWDECNRLLNETYSTQKRPAKTAVHVFAGFAFCSCGQKMYVPSNSPKYICRGCRNKITIDDLDATYADQIKGYSLSVERIDEYLKSSNQTALEKERLIQIQRVELERVTKEGQNTMELFHQGKLDAEAFSRFFNPLEERRKQIAADLPGLEAELDILKVNTLSAEEIAGQSRNLSERWPNMKATEKREIVELITEKITIGKDDFHVSFYYSPSCTDMANRWRKGWDSNPR